MLEDRQLSSLFIRKGLLDEATVQRAMALCESTKSSLYAVLLEHDLVNEEKAIVAVSKQLNLGCVSLKEFKAEPRILELVPSTLAERLQLMPLGLTEEDGERKLYLAMANPLDIDAIDEVGRISGFPVVPLLAGPKDVATALKRSYEKSREQPHHAPEDELELNLDDGLGTMLGLVEERVSHLVSESSSPGFRSEEGAGQPSEAIPIDIEPTTTKAAPPSDKLRGFSLDFSELSAGLSAKRGGADVHNKMTIPANVEVPRELASLDTGRSATPAPRPATVPVDSSQLASFEPKASSGDPDWGDLGDLGLDDEPTPNPSSSQPPSMPRNDSGGIRYVADPSLQNRKQDYLSSATASELAKATVRLLIAKGIFSEEEFQQQLRNLRLRRTRNSSES